jgi:hypothetical protein
LGLSNVRLKIKKILKYIGYKERNMKVDNTKFMDGLIEKMVNAKEGGIKRKSADLYLSKLRLLHGSPFANLSFLKNTSSIEKKLEEVGSENTKRSYATSIVSTLRFSGLSATRAYRKLFDFYRDLLDAIVQKEKDTHEDGVRTQKDIDNWLEWEDVMDLHASMEKLVSKYTKETIKAKPKQRNMMARFTILSFFVLTPPRRNLDIMLLTRCKDVKDADDEDLNFYDGESVRFNRYKTDGKFGDQTFDVNTPLKLVLDRYISMLEIPQGERIIRDPDGKPYNDGAYITKQLNAVFSPKSISSSRLRKIYATHIGGEGTYYAKAKKEMEELALRMGHGTGVQQSTYIVNEK